MAFNFFKKTKVKEMDLTGSVSSGIPLPKHLKKKITPIQSNNGIITLSDASSSQANATSTNQQPANSGGFFNFFGNDYSASPTSSSTQSSLESSNLDVTNKLSEISDRLSRLIDRVELIERKIDRLERKSS